MIPALVRWNEGHAMTKDTTNEASVTAGALLSMIGSTRSKPVSWLAWAALSRECWRGNSRARCGVRTSDGAASSARGVRHGHRERRLTGTFGKTRAAAPGGADDRRRRQDTRMMK